MEQATFRAEPLEYQARDRQSWRPLVRFCAHLAVAHAVLEVVIVATQFVTAFMSGYLTRIDANARDLAGMMGEVSVGIAAVGVIVAASACARILRGTDRWMLLASAALAGSLVLRDTIRLWVMMTPAVGVYGLLATTGYAASLATELLIPLFMIWLMRRPETRRLFGAG